MGKRNPPGGRGSSGSGQSDKIRAEQLLGGLLDRFTTVDNLLRELDGTVGSLEANVRELTAALNDQTALDIDVTQTPPAERAYDFSRTVPAGTPSNEPVTETFTIPKDGKVTRALIGFPNGTQQAAGAGIDGTDGESLIPAGPKGAKYIALNDTTVTFNLDDSVLKNREYTIRFANNDPNNDHFVNVLIFHTGDT